MIKKRFLFVLFIVFVAVMTMSFAYRGILISKEPSAIFFALGKHYFNKNDFSNAIHYFNKAIELKSDFAESYYNLGISFYYNKNIDEALNFLKEAIRIKNDYAKAHYGIALVYYNTKDFDNAILHLARVIDLEPNNANANFDLAVAYVDRFRGKEAKGSILSNDLQDLKNALKHYNKAEELKPGFQHALGNAKIVEEAISEYRQKS